MTKFVRCINSSGQPRLEHDAVYEVCYHILSSVRPGRTGNCAGYLVKLEGDNVAIPYVYNTDRFESVSD